MDASSRAELAELRVRAYGPAADITGDPVALARLEELEEMVRHEHDLLTTSDLPDEPSVYSSAEPPTPPETPEQEASGAEDQAPPRSGPSRAAVVLGIIGVAAAGVFAIPALLPAAQPAPSGSQLQLTATYQAYTLARDTSADRLFEISFDKYFGSTDTARPAFAASGPIQWSQALGDYYGWRLWIAGAAGALQREQCIALQRGTVVRTRCVPATLREQSALVATLPYSLIDRGERPEGMTSTQRIGFWWHDDGKVEVLLAQEPTF